MTGRLRHIGLIGAALAALTVAGASPAAAAAKGAPSFFNTTETMKTDLKKFGKWTGSVRRYFAGKAKNEGPCSATEFNKCHYLEWRSFIDSLRSKPRDYNLLVEVNKFLNPPNRRYITDPINWGMKDYWEAPAEFFNKHGDCEDYAITKYMTLRDLGFSTKQLRVVAVKDLNLKIGHAILIVFLGGGKTYLLDNQIKKVVETKKVRHYKAIYSINEDAWWRHKRKK